MVTHIMEFAGEADAARIRNRITVNLRKAQAVSLDDLLRSSGLTADRLLHHLGRLEASGHVKALRPVTHRDGAPGTHYRLVRSSDRDYLWEQAVEASGRLTRIGRERSGL